MDDFTDRSQFRIDDLLVIPGRLIVVRDGQEIKLEPRWMEVLVMLAEHAGETLSTERLLIEVWGSTVYGDSPVSKTISYIRKNIGDDSRKPRYVETVSKVGYRLIAEVSLPEDYRRMPSERWTRGSPYVGLSAFGADHASVFEMRMIFEFRMAEDVGSRTKGRVASNKRTDYRRQRAPNDVNLKPVPTWGQVAERSGLHGRHDGGTSTLESCGDGTAPHGFY